jgi:hypothetical protein
MVYEVAAGLFLVFLALAMAVYTLYIAQDFILSAFETAVRIYAFIRHLSLLLLTKKQTQKA